MAQPSAPDPYTPFTWSKNYPDRGLDSYMEYPGPGYTTSSLRLIPGDLYSACPHRKFHTITGLLHNRFALPNSYHEACLASGETVCINFMMVFVMTQPGRKPTTYRMRGGHHRL